MEHLAWPDISNAHNLRRDIIRTAPPGPIVHKYRAKVKLHGTNAGVQIHNGEVGVQSRNEMVSAGHFGFAAWVAERKEEFLALGQEFGRIVVYGEWCGPGVQKGVAVSQIPEKVFVVFAIRNVAGDGTSTLTDDPTRIRNIVGHIPGVYVLPWFGEPITIDWMAPNFDSINEWVASVEACDPFIASTFGVSGIGEGLVLYPEGTWDDFVSLAFKAKGKQHAVVAHAKPAQAEAPSSNSAEEFAALVVTEPRFRQGVEACGAEDRDPKKLGVFLTWIQNDIDKEAKAELAASGLDRRVALRACATRARTMYLHSCGA